MISHKLIDKLRASERILVLTGAGISAESGLATFRDPDGHWDQYRPEDLANEVAFRRNPSLVQGWYAARRKATLAAIPNPGHLALVALSSVVPELTLVTQNVDCLHQRAGSEKVIELHGNIHQFYCIECGSEAPESAFSLMDAGKVANCAGCGGLMRPSVVWFGEALPKQALDEAWARAEVADVLLSIGTSGLVYPAAHLPMVAKRAGAFLVEINLTPSALTKEMDLVLSGRAGEVLPALLAALQTPKNG